MKSIVIENERFFLLSLNVFIPVHILYLFIFLSYIKTNKHSLIEMEKLDKYWNGASIDFCKNLLLSVEPSHIFS